jgi:hypothetical protein
MQTLASKVVVFACAAGAGAHAGLALSHLQSEPRMGVAFVAAVLLLLATGLLAALRPADMRVASAAALLRRCDVRYSADRDSASSPAIS